MPISGGRGWWSTIEVPQGSRVSETGSKHHPQARARWHSRPQSNICKYLPSLPFLSCKDLNKVEFLLSQIGLFAIPLWCELYRKDRSNGVLAFWVVIVSASQRFKWCFGAFRYDGFVSQTALQVSVCEGLRFAKMVGDLNRFFMCFY
jgi:hypothetical protein